MQLYFVLRTVLRKPCRGSLSFLFLSILSPVLWPVREPDIVFFPHHISNPLFPSECGFLFIVLAFGDPDVTVGINFP